MKKILLIVTILFGIYSCNHQLETKVEDNSKVELKNIDFDWLLGKWTRVNDQENKKTFENWEKISNLEYIGFSYTMENNDTVWQERVKLIKTINNWSFNVTEKGEIEPTKFALSEIKEKKFICENQLNEFPKKIEYELIGNILHAKISGNDIEVLFDFKKSN